MFAKKKYSKCHKNIIKTILKHQTEIGAVQINQFTVISKLFQR